MTDMDLTPENVEQHPWIDLERSQTEVNFLGGDVFVWTIETDLMRELLDHPETEPNTELMNFGDDGEIYSFYGKVPFGDIGGLAER